jgi:hypothetical protein
VFMKLSISGAVAVQKVSSHTRVHRGKGRGPSRLRCFGRWVPPVDTSKCDAEHDKGESLNTGLGNLGDFELGQLQGYLQGVNFPASKEEVAFDAESNNAPQDLVQQIRNSGVDTFNSADEVVQKVQSGQ